MTKLLITEITRMGPAFCVIGLQHDQQKFQSIRPISSTANSWLHFPYQRGEILECSLTPFCGTPPHVEDRVSTRDFRRCSTVVENEVAGYLRKAECSDSLSGLFECRIYENKRGSGTHVLPTEARRSICGCRTQNLRLELCGNELRATLVLSSGELLRDLPVVDRLSSTTRSCLVRIILSASVSPGPTGMFAGSCWTHSFRCPKRIGLRSFDGTAPYSFA